MIRGLRVGARRSPLSAWQAGVAIGETLTAIKRAGADVLITNFAATVATRLAGGPLVIPPGALHACR